MVRQETRFVYVSVLGSKLTPLHAVIAGADKGGKAVKICSNKIIVSKKTTKFKLSFLTFLL